MSGGSRAVRRISVSRGFLRVAVVVTGIGLLAWLTTLPLVTREGVNYRVRLRSVPLYLKAAAFLLRDAEYRRLAAEITQGLVTDEARVMRLAQWTRDHIRSTPVGWPVVDDHIHHIIIRGYGEADQAADVFTTLAAYAGVPAFWKIVTARSGRGMVVLAFAKIDGQWTVWDIRRGIALRDARGTLADIEELRADPALVGQTTGAATHAGQAYRLYVEDALATMTIPAMLRPYQQMPWPRALFELRRLWFRWSGAKARLESRSVPLVHYVLT